MKSLKDFIIESTVEEAEETSKTFTLDFNGIDDSTDMVNTLKAKEGVTEDDENVLTFTVQKGTTPSYIEDPAFFYSEINYSNVQRGNIHPKILCFHRKNGSVDLCDIFACLHSAVELKCDLKIGYGKYRWIFDYKFRVYYRACGTFKDFLSETDIQSF